MILDLHDSFDLFTIHLQAMELSLLLDSFISFVLSIAVGYESDIVQKSFDMFKDSVRLLNQFLLFSAML